MTFIEKQQELANDWYRDRISRGIEPVEAMKLTTAQIIQNTGEELMRRCSELEQQHHYNTDGVDMDLVDRDTMKQHITNVTGVEK